MDQIKSFMAEKLTKTYQKSEIFEEVLISLNKQLNSSQKELYKDNLEDQTTIHIIGSPRSGTTVLSQLILSNINVGYINNFIATFWNAPIYGIHLSKKLLGDNYQSDLKSNFGRTTNLQEPHEFGYFWKHQLNYKEHLQQTYNKEHKIDWLNLRNILNQMCFAYQKPILFKSFLYGFHIKKAVQEMPKTLFIYLERDIYQNAYSILKLRKKMFGDETVWASMKPEQYSFLKNENIYRQIMGQVLFLNNEYKKQLKAIPEENKISINYTNLCENVEGSINEIFKKINNFTAVELDYKANNLVKENNAVIPENIRLGLEEAEKWLLSTFPELNK
ncbi:sulfotransferase [Aurantibacter sp.]|uniref:sulfotransferase n=1 Tax=Aurantibacter sp. TaxID=2807103 RepID=UPI0035C83DD8